MQFGEVLRQDFEQESALRVPQIHLSGATEAEEINVTPSTLPELPHNKA